MSRRKIVSIDLMGHLCLVPDPRQRKVKHTLINVLFIAVIASLCGVDDFVGMEALAHDSGSVVAAVGLEELCRRQGRTEEMTRYGTLAAKAWHRAKPSDLALLRQKIASLKPNTRAGTKPLSTVGGTPGD